MVSRIQEISFSILLLRVRVSVLRVLLLPLSVIALLAFAVIGQRLRLLLMPLNVSRVGHLGVDAEYALSEIDRDSSRSQTRLIAVPIRVDLPVANHALLRAWKDCMWWIPGWLGGPMLWFFRLSEPGRRFVYSHPKRIAGRFDWGSDPYGVTADGISHLKFSATVRTQSIRQLQSMGLDFARPIVCLHVRDDQYHNVHSGNAWREPHRWRNLELSVFELAARSLASRGFQVVRLGVHTRESFAAADEVAIFDYARNGHRTDVLDVFLVSECAFMISTGSGIDSLTQTFRKPLYNVGLIAPSQLYIHRRIYSILQRFEHIETGRCLSLAESLELPKISDHSLTSMGLRAIRNSAEEIAELATEAAERFLGNWCPTEEDIDRQNRFVALLPSEFRQFPIRGGIGSGFLRRHPEWLA